MLVNALEGSLGLVIAVLLSGVLSPFPPNGTVFLPLPQQPCSPLPSPTGLLAPAPSMGSQYGRGHLDAYTYGFRARRGSITFKDDQSD